MRRAAASDYAFGCNRQLPETADTTSMHEWLRRWRERDRAADCCRLEELLLQHRSLYTSSWTMVELPLPLPLSQLEELLPLVRRVLQPWLDQLHMPADAEIYRCCWLEGVDTVSYSAPLRSLSFAISLVVVAAPAVCSRQAG